MSGQRERIDNGTDLALSWPRNHRYTRGCPECGKDCTREALVRLAYTFEVCICGQPDYDHLVERLHHKACLFRPFGPAITRVDLALAQEGETPT